MPLGTISQPYLKSVLWMFGTVVDYENKLQKWKFYVASALAFSSYIASITCALHYVLYGAINDPDKMLLKFRALTLLCGVSQFSVTHIVLLSSRQRLIDVLNASNQIFKDIKNDPSNIEDLLLADSASRSTIRIVGIGMICTVLIPICQALWKIFVSGNIYYSFEMSTFPSPVLPGWIFNAIIIVPTAIIIWSFYSFLISIIHQLTAYCKALDRMFKKRPTVISVDYDRSLVKLHRNVFRLRAILIEVVGIVGIIEILPTTTRCCISIHNLLLVASRGEMGKMLPLIIFFVTSTAIPFILCTCGQTLENQSGLIYQSIIESSWYEVPPSARKPILQLLIFNENSGKMHYRHLITFNYETFGKVIQSSFSLMTVLSHIYNEDGK